MNAQTLFTKGSELIKNQGFTISGYSVCESDLVQVFSREAKGIMPKAEYSAILCNGEWIEETRKLN